MEQIVIYNRLGQVKRNLLQHSKLCTVKSAEQKKVLLGEDTLQMQVESVEPLDLQIGDYVEMYGSEYTLNQMPQPTKQGERKYSTQLNFEGLQYKLIDVMYRNKDVLGHNTTGTFQLVCTLQEAVQVLINCLNAHAEAEGSGEVWELGECPTTEYKDLSFSEENCLAVLQRLCGEECFNIEFELEALGNRCYKVHLRKAGSVFPAAFTFGKGGGVYELKRKNVDSKNVVTRLYVEGGTRNIPSTYRQGAQRLRLAGESYIQQAEPVAAFGIKEGGKKFEDIYPKRIGTVSSLGSSVYEFCDADMFDLNEKDSKGQTRWLIDGTSAKIKFLTGDCAGYELEVAKYDTATHKFRVKPYEDSRGFKIPAEGTTAYQIKEKDTYVLLDIIMPQDPYVTDAEAKLQQEGTAYYEQNCQPRVAYELSIKSLYLKRKYGSEGTVVNLFSVGDYVTVRDSEIGVDKAIRIKEFTRNALTDPYEYKLTLSDVVEVSVLERLIADSIETDKIIEINDLTNLAKARSNWRTTQELLNMVFDGDGYFEPTHIKPSSIETMMLSVGNRAGQFVIRNLIIEANAIVSGKPNANTVKITSNGAQLIHYAIEETDRTWSLQSATATKDVYNVTLTSANAYYVYAKCPQTGSTGQVVLSQDKLATLVGTDYYFLMGILSSVYNNYRELTLTYGSTRITGRTINCGKIESIDQSTYFDLDKAEIGGNIKFKSTSGGTRNVNELEGDIAGMGTDIGLLKTATTGLQSDVDAHTQAIGNLQTASGQQAAQIVSLQTLTGTKARMYITASESVTPTTPYAKGDLWLMTDTYKIKICVTASSTAYNAAHWQWAGYTDDTAANNALAGLSSLADDSLITPAEKLQLQTDKSNIVADYVVVLAQVKAAGVTTTNFESAYNTLMAYIDTLLEDMGTATEIVRGTYNSNFSNYYTQRANVLKAHTAVIENGISENGTTIEELEGLINGHGDTLQEMQDMIDSLQEQVDGTVEYWYGNVAPTLNNEPAKNWSDADTRNNHVGDIYTDTETGLEYRFSKQGNSYVWQNVPSTGIGTAIQTANQAMDLAGIKAHVYVTQNASTTPPATYKRGDLWVMLDTMHMRYCVQDGDGTAYNAAHWADAGYTDDTAANAALSQLESLADDSVITPAEKLNLQTKWAELAADYSVLLTQATNAGVGTTLFTYYYNLLKTMVEGLLEDMTTESTVTRTTYNNRFSNYYKHRATLQKNMTEGKSKVYTTSSYSVKPAATYRKGDLWVTLNDYKVRICITTCTGTYSDAHWKDAGYTDDTTANEALSLLSDMADDSKITPAEKLQLGTMFSDIIADFASLSLQATSLGINTTALEQAYSELHSYLAGILNNMESTDEVDRSVYESKFTTYYTERGNVSAAIGLAKARTYITANYNTKPSTTTYKAGDLWLTLNDCKIRICQRDCDGSWRNSDWVAAGYTDDTAANAAQALLDAMGSDSKITPAEKLQLQTEINNIRADYTSIKAKADAVGVSATALTTAYNALTTYVATILANMSSTSTIDRSEYNNKFYAYYTARATLMAEISGKQAQNAVDGLEIGQGNYINNGAFFTSFAGWEVAADTKQLYADSTMGSCMRFGKSNTTNFFFLHTGWVSKQGNIALPANKFNEGTTYTLAFWVRANKSIQLRVGFMNPAGDVAVQQYTDFVAGTSWQRISLTFKANGNSREDTRLYIRGEHSTVFEWLLFTKFVLVEGNKAPEWSASTSELKALLQAQIDANNAVLEAIQGNYTQIDGGLILSTFLKLGAILSGGLYQESAGVKAMLNSKDEVAAYFGGTLAEANAGKAGMTTIYHNGKLKADNVEIDGKVTARSGSIGGLAIGNGWIGAEGATESGYVDEISISPRLFCISGRGKWVGMGSTLPSTTNNTCVMRVENTQSNSYYVNYGIKVQVAGGQINYAMTANAPIVTSKWLTGYAFKAITPDMNTCWVVGEKIWSDNPFLIIAKYLYSNSGIGLPKRQTVATWLNISTNTSFAVKITIISQADSTQNGYIVGRNTAISGMNTADYPYIRNNNAGWEQGKIGQGKGDIDEFLLHYTAGGNYDAYWLNHRN